MSKIDVDRIFWILGSHILACSPEWEGRPLLSSPGCGVFREQVLGVCNALHNTLASIESVRNRPYGSVIFGTAWKDRSNPWTPSPAHYSGVDTFSTLAVE